MRCDKRFAVSPIDLPMGVDMKPSSAMDYMSLHKHNLNINTTKTKFKKLGVICCYCQLLKSHVYSKVKNHISIVRSIKICC